jgi:hypothetical protein
MMFAHRFKLADTICSVLLDQRLAHSGAPKNSASTGLEAAEAPALAEESKSLTRLPAGVEDDVAI